jgi:hypothetical protein
MVADELRRQCDIFCELQDLAPYIARAYAGPREPRDNYAAPSPAGFRDDAPQFLRRPAQSDQPDGLPEEEEQN